MTEDYVRRVLPAKWAVDVSKLQEKNKSDIISKCGDLCFNSFDNQQLTQKESECLHKCMYKGLEMLTFFTHEYSDMMITKLKKYENKADD